MATHRHDPTVFYNAIGLGASVLEIADGDTVITTTLDAAGFDHKGVQRAPGPNPMTGPFSMVGAESGDALEVTIVRMTPNRATGWTFSVVAPNVVDPMAVASLPRRQRVEWSIDPAGGTARLAEPPAALRDWVVPLAPMIGCFGVAPALDQALSTATSGPYGGNMDYRGFGPGAVVAFPVARAGALFYLGDGHACQGDGEIVGTGIETTFEIEFTVKVQKGRAINWPRGETAETIFTVGNARPLDQALQHATTEMLAWLAADFGLDTIAASHLLGQVVRYQVANVFNPAYSVVCAVDRKWLSKRGH